MTQSELARRMDRPVKTINEIVNGKAAITPETAIQLELTLGISASFWNQLETLYREQLARRRLEQELEARDDWARRFPLRELERVGQIPPETSKGGRVAAMLAFFALGSPAAWEKRWLAPQAQFRRSPAFMASPEATAAWLRWGERIATDHETPPFDAKRLRVVLDAIRSLTADINVSQSVQQAKELLKTAGVVLLITPEFKGIRLSGAAYWISTDKAVIQLSMRHRSDDQFWFSLFHESRHVLDRGRAGYVDAADRGGSDPAEQEADRFARDILIPPAVYEAFKSTSDFSAMAVQRFASQQGIAPGIVVARLQHDEMLDWSRLNSLKRTMRWNELSR